MSPTSEQIDAPTEVVNIGVGRAAGPLNSLLGRRIALSVPSIRICSPKELRASDLADGHGVDTSVSIDFEGSISGRALLAFPDGAGQMLAGLLGGADDPEEEALLAEDILPEVGNIVLNGVLGSLANLFNGHLEYSPPRLAIGESSADVLLSRSGDIDAMDGWACITAEASFTVEGQTNVGSLLVAFSMQHVKEHIDRLLGAVAV